MEASKPTVLRRKVGDWLRIRMANPSSGNQRGPVHAVIYSIGLNPADFAKERLDRAAQALYSQLAADAEHSALLWRLFDGKAPLDEPPPLSKSYPVYPD